MRSFAHWTPRYILDRTRDVLYSRSHPDAPWLTPQATQILSTMLRPEDHGVEFGSGRSTLWLSKRVRHLTSVEHDDVWHGTISTSLKTLGVHNVDHLFAAPDVPFDRGAESEYVRTLRRFDEGSLDFALVDGIYRDACALLSIDKLRSGGLLVVDNVERFLPSLSRSPVARRPAQGPASQVWAEVARAIGQWRHIWTSSGVSDTAIFVKP